jgi:hypothetical protein
LKECGKLPPTHGTVGGVPGCGDREDRKERVIALPAAVDPDATDAEDQRIIRTEEVKTVAKRRLKLKDALKKGYAMVYDQCSQEVKDKLEAAKDWERIQREQSLHELIQKVE